MKNSNTETRAGSFHKNLCAPAGEKTEKINALVEYFASGCKKEQLLGAELEHFLIDSDTRLSLPYKSENGAGVQEILTKLAPLYGTPIFSDGHIIGITGAGAVISLEPAAQLEISIHPTPHLAEIKNTYDRFVKIISPVLREKNCELFCAGYHPKSKISDLPLLPKKRYRYMHEHFKKTGTHGAYMMKGTASAQINIDYESEADFSKKFRVANILGPLFSLACDNTPVFEGEPAPRLTRTRIWNNTDPARCTVVPRALEGEFGFREYAEYICNLPEIFPIPENDIEQILSMAFPDVRLKNRIEIRMADSMPIRETLAYIALIKGIFYNETNLNYFFNETKNVKNIPEAKNALIAHGPAAKIYNKPAGVWLRELYDAAHSALPENEKAFIIPPTL